LVVGFGTSGRVAQTAVKHARAGGLKVGLHRPVSLYPFPEHRVAELARRVKGILVVEMNAGQMVEDVRLAINGKRPVHFYGRMGGMIPSPEEVLAQVESIAKEF
jgi:2-oxoglutarate ferredoxin oxidoreductase subunit alpha